MNQREVEKHLVFQIFFIVFIFSVMIFTIIYLLTTDVNAASDYHNVVTNAVYTGTSYCSTNQNGLCVSDTSSNSYSRYTFGTTSYQNTLSFHFVLNTSVYAKVNATVRLTGSNWKNVSYTCVSSFSNCRVVRASSTILNINFTNNTNNNVSYGEFFITGNGSIINSNDTFYVEKADLYETLITDSGSSSGSNNSDIINNQNQNTQDLINNQNDNTEDIINNNNSNTQDLMNTITNFLGIACKNLFNASNYDYSSFSTTNVTDNIVTLTGSQTWRTVAYTFNVTENSSYTFSWNSDSTGAIAYYSFDNSNWIQVNKKTPTTIIPNTSHVYIRLQNSTIGNGTYIFKELTFNKGTDTTYCPYGSVLSQLDESKWYMEKIRDAQAETNEYLKDDSNPNINDSAISDTLESVSINDPLNYLLTLPLHTIQRINYNLGRDTCTPYNLGSLFGTNLILPCVNVKEKLGNALFNTIDILMAIGIGSITLKKFYDSVSNVLTLGKEKEVREKLELPTPMEFFAMIFGGGR